MKTSLFLGAGLILTVSALWPVPSSYSSGNQVLWIDGSVKVNYNSNPQNGSHPWGSGGSRQIVNMAVQRTFATIFQQNFVPWKFNPRNSNYEPNASDGTLIKSITLHQNGVWSPNTTKASSPMDESYTLSVPLSGEVVITANTSIGLAYGLTTFSQLFFQHSKGGVYTKLAPVTVSDAPKFAHRGLNMDTSRNYFSTADIKRTLDAMAFTKMNRLHWHVTDAQSWPLEIPALPELSAAGAYAPDLVYSPSDVADIMQYGENIGIETIVEIDMPGHTSSIWFSHPELITAFNTQPYDTNCAEPPCGSLKLNSSAVYSFLDKMFDDLLPRVAQHSSYFHSGGDEVNVNAYLLDDTVKSNDTAVLQPLMQTFIDHVHGKIRAAGLTPLVWEEMLLTWNLTLGHDVLVNCWLSDESVAQTVAKGHKAIVGNYNNWYLDCGQGQWLNFFPNVSAQYYPYNDYCSPRKNWRLVYSLDPLSGVPADSAHLVAGGEVHLWAEQIDPINFDKQAWPRAAAAAEVLWSGAKDPATGQNRSQVDAAPRLSEFRERLVARGVMAEPIQMPFCTQNGTQCYL